MASSSTNPYPNYPYPSEFNVSDLVPDKLSKSNYSEWKPLMLDFIESRGMNEFIHHTTKDIEDFNDPKKDIEDPYFDDYKERSWRKSDGLVRTWILSTLNRDIIKQVLHHKTAREVWKALETMLGSLKAQQPDSSYIEIDKRLSSYMPLHISAIQGDIQSAREFMLEEPEAIRMPISTERETMLITAVRSVRRNKLVQYLLSKLSTEDLAQIDNLGRTALHVAAEVGNLNAAEMLVERNSNLPSIKDVNGQTPLLYAAKTGNREIVLFLLNHVKGSGVLETGPVPPTLLYHLANSGLYVAPVQLRNNATKNPAEHYGNSANRENPVENLQRPIDTENLANTENPVENLQSHTENPANRENPNPRNPQNLPQNLVVNENPHNDAVNPAVNENRQNLPAITDTENSVVDENPRNGAVNLVINENRQNPLAITDNSIVNENLQNVAVNPAINEHRQNPPTVTDTENSVVDENPQSGAVNRVVNENQQNSLAITENSIVNENLQNATVNPAVNENRLNTPAVTGIENFVVNENPQSGAVNPVVNENQQIPLAVTENSIVNENLQNVVVNPAVNENRQNPPAVTDTEYSVVDENPQSGAVNPVVNENQQNPLAVTENSIVNENLQNVVVNPAVNENRQNPPAVTDTEYSAVDENPQSGAVNPVVNENQQNPLAVTENSIVNENLQNVAPVKLKKTATENPTEHRKGNTENSANREHSVENAPVKLKNTATENPTEHRKGNTENSANRENHVENLQSPVDTENLANTENPVENLQSYSENPANRENPNPEGPQNLPQNLVVNENPQNDTVNPFVDENRQNPPAITDTENSVVDENPQNVAGNPVVNENRQNPLAITDNSIINENLQNPPTGTDTENSVVNVNPQNVAVNPIVNENRQNPLGITDNFIVNENLQNAAVNPIVNENRQNPPAVTDTENSVVDENPQNGAVTENPPIIENNLQNPVNIAGSENPQNCTITENLTVTENPIINEQWQNLVVTDNSIVNENPQIGIDINADSIVNENLQNPVYETPHNDIDNPQNPVDDKKVVGIFNPRNLAVDGIVTGRRHAMFSHLADNFVTAIMHIREIKLKHHEALELVKCLCKEIAKLDFSTATWIFTPALAQATSSGIHEIVEEILRSYPAAISLKNENNQSIFQSAIVWRRENVFNLIYQLKECSHMFLSVPDRFGNNALHLAGCLGPQQHLSVRVSAAGAALQMQRELQWFKFIQEVEKFVLPQDKECRNDDGMTPAEVFTKTHKELIEAGERWMKDTATSCTIVAALIATVMFAAAITVPGGNNTSSSVSMFSKQKAFVIFGLSDALALFASIASLLMFLSILTARYAEEDFLYSLPNRLIIGLVNLFLSISSTMTAFSATLYLMLGENRPLILYPIVAFACIPVTLFVFLLFPLLVVMYKSTYRPAIFGKQSDHMLF